MTAMKMFSRARHQKGQSHKLLAKIIAEMKRAEKEKIENKN